MNIQKFLSIGIFCASTMLWAQNQKEILFTIGNNPYYTDEFIRVYNKNLNLVKDESQKDLDNYLDLYLSYKLKVNKAYDLGLDKDPKYLSELKSYRNQLAKGYLTDSKVTDELVREAYERSLKEIRASHILIALAEESSPQDTLKAYQKALSIRTRILKGEDFGSLAQELSDDQSAKQNKGDLGYFTTFRMVYPFENGAYNTKIGEVSKPIRSRFGYHLIRVSDIRPNRGEVTVAHIMIAKTGNAEKDKEAVEKINEIYQKLQQGENFEALAKQFSDDKTSSEQGGKLSTITSGQLNSVTFEDAAFSIKTIGEYTQPVMTEFGWHIIKLLEKHPTKSFDEMRSDLEFSIKRDERSKLIDAAMNQKLETKYKPISNTKLFKKALDLVTQAYYTEEFKIPENTDAFNKVILSIQNKNISGIEFLNYIKAQQNRMQRIESLEKLKSLLHENFISSQLTAYYDENLETEFPEFAHVIQEYKEGLLLFDLMEKEIWQKAKTDTLGLEAFYQKNKDNYRWNERLEAIVATSVKPEYIEKTQKFFKKNKSVAYIKKQLNKDGVVNIMLNEGLFEQKSSSLPKAYTLAKGVSDIYHEGDYYYVILGQKITPSAVKTLEEAKGRVISDYQQYLEEHWVENLKKEYNFKVDTPVFQRVKNQLNHK